MGGQGKEMDGRRTSAASPPLSSNLFPCAALMQEPQCSSGAAQGCLLKAEVALSCRPHLAAGPIWLLAPGCELVP